MDTPEEQLRESQLDPQAQKAILFAKIAAAKAAGALQNIPAYVVTMDLDTHKPVLIFIMDGGIRTALLEIEDMEAL